MRKRLRKHEAPQYGTFIFGIDDALLVGGAASALGGILGANASQKAAQTQAQAAQYAADLQNQQFQQTRSDLAPYRGAGTLALSDLQSQLPNLTKPFTMADFQASPAYNFNLEQGQLAINKGAAARGQFYNPATLQDIARFSQGLASNEFQNAFNNYQTTQGNIWNRLYGLTGLGEQAATQTGAAGATAAGNIGNFATQGANAQAAGTVGSANALSGAFSGIGNTAILSQILKNDQNPIFFGTGNAPY